MRYIQKQMLILTASHTFIHSKSGNPFRLVKPLSCYANQLVTLNLQNCISTITAYSHCLLHQNHACSKCALMLLFKIALLQLYNQDQFKLLILAIVKCLIFIEYIMCYFGLGILFYVLYSYALLQIAVTRVLHVLISKFSFGTRSYIIIVYIMKVQKQFISRQLGLKIVQFSIGWLQFYIQYSYCIYSLMPVIASYLLCLIHLWILSYHLYGI